MLVLTQAHRALPQARAAGGVWQAREHFSHAPQSTAFITVRRLSAVLREQLQRRQQQQVMGVEQGTKLGPPIPITAVRPGEEVVWGWQLLELLVL